MAMRRAPCPTSSWQKLRDGRVRPVCYPQWHSGLAFTVQLSNSLDFLCDFSCRCRTLIVLEILVPEPMTPASGFCPPCGCSAAVRVSHQRARPKLTRCISAYLVSYTHYSRKNCPPHVEYWRPTLARALCNVRSNMSGFELC